MKHLFLLGFLLNVTNLFSAEWVAQEEIYYDSCSQVLNIRYDYDEIIISEEHFESLVFNNISKLGRYTTKNIYFSEFETIEYIDAYTLNPFKKKTKKYPVETINQQDVLLNGVFYGGFKKKKFVYPNIQNGSQTFLKYKVKLSNPHLLGGYFFSKNLPVKRSSYVIKVQDGIDVDYKIFNGNGLVDVKEVRKGKFKIISFTASNVERVIFEDNSPGKGYFEPHIHVFIKGYKKSKEYVSVNANLDDLYSWYSILLKKSGGVGDDFKKISEGLLAEVPVADTIQRIKTLYQWVQQNIKYIAFEDGLHGFVPRNPEEVYRKKYGDCKDMANLLTTMLNQEGIDAHNTWIGSRQKPYSYSDLPTTSTDNHMITTVLVSGDYLFLDPTASYNPFGLPSSFIQGKDALIGLTDSTYIVKTVPVVESSLNNLTDTVRIKLSDDGILGQGTMVLNGFKKHRFDREYLHENKMELDDFLVEYLGRNNDKFSLNNYVTENINVKSDHSTIQYEFAIEGYSREVGGNIYLKPIFFNDVPVGTIDVENRVHSVENDYKHVENNVFVIELDDNYKVDFLPESNSQVSNLMSYEINYRKEDNQIIVEYLLAINFMLMESTEFKEWNTILSKLIKARNTNIILSKK